MTWSWNGITFSVSLDGVSCWISQREKKREARPFELEVGISALGPSILEKEWIELPDLSLPAQGCSLFATKQTKKLSPFFIVSSTICWKFLFSFEGKVEQWISTLIWVTSEIQLLQLLPPSNALRSLIHWFDYCLLFFMSKLIGFNTKVHVSFFYVISLFMIAAMNSYLISRFPLGYSLSLNK